MDSNISAIIVDDEQKSIDALKWKLESTEYDVNVLKEFTEPKKALSYLKNRKLDIVFLDIEMPGINGIDFLKELSKLDTIPSVIFVTGYQDYIIEALRNKAFDYLLKPINLDELSEALSRFDKKQQKESADKLIDILQEISANNPEAKVALPTTERIIYLEKKDINYCASDSNYTIFYLLNGEKIIIAKTLGKVEPLLGNGFMRVHQSFIINKREVVAYNRGVGGSLSLKSGDTIPVSKTRKEEVLAKLML